MNCLKNFQKVKYSNYNHCASFHLSPVDFVDKLYLLNTLADKPKMDFPLCQFILCYVFLKIFECILMKLHLYENAFVSVWKFNGNVKIRTNWLLCSISYGCVMGRKWALELCLPIWTLRSNGYLVTSLNILRNIQKLKSFNLSWLQNISYKIEIIFTINQIYMNK